MTARGDISTVNFSSLSECAEADHLSCFARAG